MVLSGTGQVNSLAKTTGRRVLVANLSPGMSVSGVAELVPRRNGAYWRDLLLGRLVPSLFFSLFLARELILLWGGLGGIHKPMDLLFVLQQALALAYFTLLVVLYAVRLPQRGTDHRLTVIFIAFSGTFAAISASVLPGGSRREGLVLVADILATAGLAYSGIGRASCRER